MSAMDFITIKDFTSIKGNFSYFIRKSPFRVILDVQKEEESENINLCCRDSLLTLNIIKVIAFLLFLN